MKASARPLSYQDPSTNNAGLGLLGARASSSEPRLRRNDEATIVAIVEVLPGLDRHDV